MSIRQTALTGLPHTLSFLHFAEGKETPPRDAFANQVTFPIYAEAQLVRLKTLLARKGIKATATATSREGLRVGFATEDDAVLAKMSFIL